MNNLRVLRFSNVLLLLTGYLMHWFDSKQQRYRLSLPGAVHVFVLACIYAGCFAQHFQASSLLKTLLDVSPFLYALTRLQLLLSVKVFSYAIYASVRAVGVANALTVSLPMANLRPSRWAKAELIAYGLLGSTFAVLACFGLYIGYEMEFKLPPLKDIMIGSALFLPHLVLAGALRFYTTFAWLAREQLRQLLMAADELLSAGHRRTELEVLSGSVFVDAPASLDNLLSVRQQLAKLATLLGQLFDSLQHSLLLLLCINANCLLFGVHSFVYYWSTWHVLFDDRKRRVFYAANASIYACIGCDYTCLLLAQTLLEQQCLRFGQSLDSRLAQRDALSKETRRVVKDLRLVLTSSFRFKFLSTWRFNLANFALLQLLQFLVIALIVIYHYLDDAILLTNERLNSSDDE